MYGENVTRRQILDGSIAIPADARPFLHELAEHPRESADVRP
jgi:hypothetical protein